MATTDENMVTPQEQSTEQSDRQEARQPAQQEPVRQESVQQEPAQPEAADEPAKRGQQSTFEQIKNSVSEDDDAPIGSLTLRKILGGDILSASMVRSQIWLLLLIVLFITVSVAFRYQCQQDILEIAQLEKRLTDVKYKALSSSSQLTERCRESHVLKMLQQNKDSLLHISTQPPYIVTVPED